MPLGKSLNTILDDYFGPESEATNLTGLTTASNSSILEIPVNSITVSQHQTRTSFDLSKIISLAENIKKYGLIHPVVVLQKKFTSTAEPEYILLAGERRVRAFKHLQKNHIPAIVKSETDLDQKSQAVITAMENLQREDLNPIELASTFKMLMQTQQVSEIDLATDLNVSIQYIKNHLRLLTLSSPVKEAVASKQIGEGQARQLVPLEPKLQEKYLQIIIEKDLTVKEIISLLKAEKLKQPKSPNPTKVDNVPNEYKTRIESIKNTFPNAKIDYSGTETKGKITISWKSKKTK